MLLEICAFNIQSCFIAERAGAGRIELCADPLHGGTTPSFGLIEYALEHVSIPIYVMLRPRGGNFVYDDHEFEIMKKDVLMCKALGCPGIATGIQLANGEIDRERMKELIALAYPMAVTCHKAFDATPDASRSLENLIWAGCERVLTSGLHKTAVDGAQVLAELVKQAVGRIIVMPGGNVRSGNIAQLIRETGAAEYHSSGSLLKAGDFIANADEVNGIKEAMDLEI